MARRVLLLAEQPERASPDEYIGLRLLHRRARSRSSRAPGANKRMHLMKSALVTGAAAFTGDPQCSADLSGSNRERI